MEQTYTQTNESGLGVTGLRLLFRLTRSRIVSIRVEGLPEGVEATAKTVTRLGAEVTWDAVLPENSSVTALLEYEGEPLVLTDLVWITEGAEDNFLVGFAEPVDPLQAGRLANDPLTTVVEDPVRLFAARYEAIQRTEDPLVKKYQEFFWHYDHQTNPPLVADNPDIPPDEKRHRREVIGRTAGVLSERVTRRASIVGDGRAPEPGELPRVPEVSWIGYLSNLQLGIMQRWLPDGEGGVDAAALWEAFEMFTNGELRVQVAGSVWNSEPDSAFELSFAEFALVAVEEDVDADRWGPLLGGLVMSQEIFAQTYRPGLPPPFYYRDYHSSNFAPEKQVDAAFKERLRAKYEELSAAELAEQAGKNAFAAFPAGFSRPPQPAPVG